MQQQIASGTTTDSIPSPEVQMARSTRITLRVIGQTLRRLGKVLIKMAEKR